ncbi:zinc ABC transporter ATP-binding protein AztA [Microbacterium sp. Marseille-Q6965]|uniref:zinc ABC transporter ATP-binding protein AztA n=1 Tax=Microbacterium sp. Marseille-Q6965 TaxID=2965072 RepID=UPI0021B7258E|nr:zinc ABC transporter ATP-binding protein AztA [Microbacterium sp. Marseille-Q6965]
MSVLSTRPGPARPLRDPRLRARDVCFAYDGADVVHAVSVELAPGTVTALCGENGSGKSTLVELLAGVKRPRAGTIVRGGSLALVVQRPDVPDALPLTVDDVVRMGTWGSPRRSRARRRRDVAAAIARVGLAGMEHRRLVELSGGQRQRALLAQGLARGADILILDEPAAGLDAASRDRVRVALADEAERGVAVLCVTHDDDAIDAADRVIRLENGMIVTDGVQAALA